MKTVIVRLGLAGKILDCQTSLMSLQLGDKCLLNEGNCTYNAEVIAYPSGTLSPCQIGVLPKIFRVMTQEDISIVADNRKKIQSKKELVLKEITKRKLKIKFVDIEYSFDQSKMICYFTAEGRIDFRTFVLRLVRMFRVRIELRQIGVRDHARIVGGVGVCGRKLCCSSHLRTFHSVSIKMAREQSVGVVPDNMSGVCGKLLCCLAYEYKQYDQFVKNMYPKGTLIETKQGIGIVSDVYLLKQELKVELCETRESFLCSIDDVLKVIKMDSLVKK